MELMDVKVDFIDTEEFDSESKEFLEIMNDDERVRLIRGYKGKPSFILEEDDTVVAELRPTENSNYVLYKREASDGLVAKGKVDHLNHGLKIFVDEEL